MSGQVAYVRLSPDVQGGISTIMQETEWSRSQTVEALCRKALGFSDHGLPGQPDRHPQDIAREGFLAGTSWALGLLTSIARNSDSITGKNHIEEVHRLVTEIAQDADPLAVVLPWSHA